MTQKADAPPQNDVTPVTNRRVLHIAVPIVLSNATVPILGAVDTGVVGQLGEAAPIGAVGLGAVILSTFYWVFGFLRMGTVGLVGQAHGANDQPEVTAILMRALLIGGAAGLLIVLAQAPLFALAFWTAPASPDVESLTSAYIGIRVWSAPAAIALYGITGWLIALERTRAVLAIQLWMNGLNIVLDLWFVLGLDWGVEGVAIATFIAEWSGAALGLWLCRGAFRQPDWRNPARIFDRNSLWRMAALNRDILIRSLLLEAIFVSFLFFGAGLGDTILAANQVLLQFLMVTAYALDGFAFAAEALVAQAYGAKNRLHLRKSALLTSAWAFGTALLMAACFAAAGAWIIDLMAKATDVQSTARIYLAYLVLVPPLGCAAFMLDGIFVGATRSVDMRNMMVVSALIYAAALAVLLPNFGNHGLWSALLISLVARGVTLGLRYPRLEASVAHGPKD